MTSDLTCFFLFAGSLPGGRLPSWAGFRPCRPNLRQHRPLGPKFRPSYGLLDRNVVRLKMEANIRCDFEAIQIPSWTSERPKSAQAHCVLHCFLPIALFHSSCYLWPSWSPLGGLLGPSWVLWDASWMPRGCLLGVSREHLGVLPDAIRCHKMSIFTQVLQAFPLLGASGCTRLQAPTIHLP